MKIRDIFETRIEEKIDPVVKVGERQDSAKLASEIGSYVITPTIEKYVDDFLEHYTETFRRQTTEIGAWISGYFGSGKSYLAKILALLAENPTLDGHSAAKRFEARVPSNAPRRESIRRGLNLLDQCGTQVLAFNLNTIADSKTTPLARLLLSQYYQSRGYSVNLLYAKVIERELDRLGKLGALHEEVAKVSGRPWEDIQRNPSFYANALYQAACNVAPEAFRTPQEAAQQLRDVERGELFNIEFLVQTILEDLNLRQQQMKKPARILLVLDESGQWIGDDSDRLAKLQALVEESAIRGQGKIWIFVTSHEDMGAVYQNARALQADFKKIEGRFRFKWSLTTENIELVLEDRIFRKKIAGRNEVELAYDAAPGVLRGLGELGNVEGRRLPDCDRDRFTTFYPFFPYQVHLIPEIVKSLRAKGGRGEQLSGSTRTLLAITQDILRAGRRPYLDSEVGEMVSFDEVYGNLAGEGEVAPDIRRELSLIETDVPGATVLTRRAAEVLFLLHDIKYVPRTLDNLARLLVESTSEDLPQVVGRIRPEIERLMAAKMVARIGEEYEFLTGERRSFEDEVGTAAAQLRHQDREAALAKHFVFDPERKQNHIRSLLGFDTVPYKDSEFEVRISMDETSATKRGDVEIRISSPLAALSGTKVQDLEDRSLRDEERYTIFVLCDRIPGFDQDLNRFLAMQQVIANWKGDNRKSEEARRLAEERELNDLPKLRRRVEDGIKDGLRHSQIVFRGASRAVSPRPGQTPGEALRAELATYWPSIYPKFDKVPVRISHEQEAIRGVLRGDKDLPSEVRALGIQDKGGALNLQAPVIDSVRIFLAARQNEGKRTLGADLLEVFSKPEYGWDPNAVRVGVAACVRGGVIQIQIGKMPHNNPADPALEKVLRDSREFDKAELILEQTELTQDALERARATLIRLTGKRRIDETVAALHEAMENLGKESLARAEKFKDWADAAGFPRPNSYEEGTDAFQAVLQLRNPLQRIKEVDTRTADLQRGQETIKQLADFREKWSGAFLDASKLSRELRAVEHLVPENSRAKTFLDEFTAAGKQARFAEPDIWKAIQGTKASAELELQSLLETWRDDARQIAREALDRLPDNVRQHGLNDSLVQTLGRPLKSFLETLENETEPARVAALSQRARQLVANLDRAIEQEIEKSHPPQTKEQPPREIRRLRISDVNGRRRLRADSEWEALRDALDTRCGLCSKTLTWSSSNGL